MLIPFSFSQRFEMPQGAFFAEYNVKEVKLNQTLGTTPSLFREHSHKKAQKDIRLLCFFCGSNTHNLLLFALRQFVDLGDVAVGEFLDFVEGVAFGVFGMVLSFNIFFRRSLASRRTLRTAVR